MVVPPDDGVLAALNVALFTGGSFIYVPAGVKVDVPLQTFLGIAVEARGPFERTLLVVVDEADRVDYLEGCSTACLLGRCVAHDRGRTRREPGEQGLLYDHPELVEERAQCCHQESGRRRRGPGPLGRRKHRIRMVKDPSFGLPKGPEGLG